MLRDTRSSNLFFLGCMPARFALAGLAYYAASSAAASSARDWLRVMGWLALIPACGFLVLFLAGARRSGPETFGAPIWWNTLRPVHAGLYFLFSYLALGGAGAGARRYAWTALALDAAVGLVAGARRRLGAAAA